MLAKLGRACSAAVGRQPAVLPFCSTGSCGTRAAIFGRLFLVLHLRDHAAAMQRQLGVSAQSSSTEQDSVYGRQIRVLSWDPK
jgi:hypothetical protein